MRLCVSVGSTLAHYHLSFVAGNGFAVLQPVCHQSQRQRLYGCLREFPRKAIGGHARQGCDVRQPIAVSNLSVQRSAIAARLIAGAGC